MEVIKRSYESMYITDAQLAVYKEQGFLISSFGFDTPLLAAQIGV